MSRRPGAKQYMWLETFRGRDVQSVSEAARRSLGEHAVVLRMTATRAGRTQQVEIVAAAAAEIERFRARLAGRPLPDLDRRYEGVRPLVIALVGPGGAGKTTTLAKLATHPQAFAGRSVGFLTLDTFRVGAVEELRSYAELTGNLLEVVYHEEEVPAALERLSASDVILVDTPGRWTGAAAGWFPLLRAIAPDEVHLLLPAAIRAEAAVDASAALCELDPTHLLLTRLDEVRQDRGVADIALALRLPARWVTDGHELPDTLHAAPARIVTALAELSEGAAAAELRIPA